MTARFLASIFVATVLAAPAAAQPASERESQATREYEARGNRMNFADWRRFGFFCSMADRPSKLAVALCTAATRAALDAARRGGVEIEVARQAVEYGYQTAQGRPFLVAQISGTGDPRTGAALHFALRAEQYFEGPVTTRFGENDAEPQAPRRRGTLVLWEDSATGYVSGPTALRDVESHVTSIVQRFFVTLYGARR